MKTPAWYKKPDDRAVERRVVDLALLASGLNTAEELDEAGPLVLMRCNGYGVQRTYNVGVALFAIGLTGWQWNGRRKEWTPIRTNE